MEWFKKIHYINKNQHFPIKRKIKYKYLFSNIHKMIILRYKCMSNSLNQRIYNTIHFYPRSNMNINSIVLAFHSTF